MRSKLFMGLLAGLLVGCSGGGGGAGGGGPVSGGGSAGGGEVPAQTVPVSDPAEPPQGAVPEAAEPGPVAQKSFGYVEIPINTVEADSGIEEHEVQIAESPVDDETFGQVLETIPEGYEVEILSKPFRVRADPVTSDKTVQVSVKIPQKILEEHDPSSLGLMAIAKDFLDRPLPPEEGGDARGPAAGLFPFRNTALDGDVLRAEIPASSAEDIHVVLGTTGIFGRGDKTMAVYHPTSDPNKDKPLANLTFVYDPPQAFKDLFKQYLIRIWDHYDTMFGFNMKQVGIPIEIHIVDRLKGSAGAVDMTTGLMQISYFNAGEMKKEELVAHAGLLAEDAQKYRREMPYKMPGTLAHEMFHYISHFYAVPQKRWGMRYRPIEEGAANYYENMMFSLNENWVNEKGSIVDNADHGNAAPFSIYDRYQCEEEQDDFWGGLTKVEKKLCELNETTRAMALYAGNISEQLDYMESRASETYSFYSRFFRWAASLNPDFVREFYESVDQAQRIKVKDDGTVIYRDRSLAVKVRDLLEEQIIALLKNPRRAIAGDVQERIKQEHTALFVAPGHPFLEFYANYLLMFHHPSEAGHPTGYYPFWPDVEGSEAKDDVFPHDDFVHPDRHRTSPFDASLSYSGYYESLSISKKGRWERPHSNGLREEINRWRTFSPEGASPKHPATARLLRVYFDPELRGEGNLDIEVRQGKNGTFRKIGYLLFREEKPGAPLEYLDFKNMEHQNENSHNFPLDCHEKSCPNFFILLANSNFDYRPYDDNPRRYGSIFEIKDDAEIAGFLKNLPELGVRVRANFEPEPDEKAKLFSFGLGRGLSVDPIYGTYFCHNTHKTFKKYGNKYTIAPFWINLDIYDDGTIVCRECGTEIQNLTTVQGAKMCLYRSDPVWTEEEAPFTGKLFMLGKPFLDDRGNLVVTMRYDGFISGNVERRESYDKAISCRGEEMKMGNFPYFDFYTYEPCLFEFTYWTSNPILWSYTDEQRKQLKEILNLR